MASHEQFMHAYHDALLNEIKNFVPLMPKNPSLNTIYLGGGTPSTYPASLLLDMFVMLKSHFVFDQKTEVTIEVNPGTATLELLQVWHQAGINRLSIGVQSLKDTVLKSLNRHQTQQNVETLLSQAAPLFENISVDFILGLPEISDDEWKAMIEHAMQWPIKHISIYFLTVHEDTPLYFKIKTNRVQLPPDDGLVDLYDWTVQTLQNHGFVRYEVSNFAKTGFESRHNQAYWNRGHFKGFGLGAWSFNGSGRFANTKNLGKYLEAMQHGQEAIDASETLTSQDVALEKIMLSLRQARGLHIYEYLEQSSNVVSQEMFFNKIDQLQKTGFIEKDKEFIRLTAKGYAVQNEIVLQLFS